jgi:hypothetical protein
LYTKKKKRKKNTHIHKKCWIVTKLARTPGAAARARPAEKRGNGTARFLDQCPRGTGCQVAVDRFWQALGRSAEVLNHIIWKKKKKKHCQLRLRMQSIRVLWYFHRPFLQRKHKKIKVASCKYIQINK